MSIKLIAIDIDGTLVDDQKQLDTATSSLLSDLANKGVRVVLCTGRPYLGAQAYLEQMGFHKDSEQYVITHNGALISKTDSSSVKALPLDSALVKEIMTYCLEKGLRFHLSTHEHMYTPNDPISPYTVNESHHTNMLLRPFMDMDTLEHLDVFDVMIADDSHLLDENEATIRDRFGNYCEIVRSEPHFYRVYAPLCWQGQGFRLSHTVSRYLLARGHGHRQCAKRCVYA